MCSCIQVIRDISVKSARKERHCDATNWLWESGLAQGLKTPFTFSELRLIVLAKRDNSKIKIGQPYIKQISIQEDEFCIFSAREEMHKLCLKYHIYPCEC